MTQDKNIALLTSLDNIDFREWCELICSTKKCIDFCQNVGLIGFTLNEPCAQGHNHWKSGSCGRASDEFVWRCGKDKSTRTIRHGTFFSNSKLAIRQVLDLTYFWAEQIDSHAFLRRHYKFASESTVVDWKNFARDCCGEHFLRYPVVIGGPWHTLEIDEIDQRGAATLLPIIHQYVRAGTTIYSDQWAAYNGIANGTGPHRYNNQIVNHSVNFVDPTTSTHTQNIENLWMCMKREKKNQMGQHATLLGTHLTEYMWRQRFGDRPFENLVLAFQEKYVVQ
ncbi:unnamed protein product [Rotaria socialis]|uniref:ISXO2-like transposase domain-containing protein n=1 Tax=Rotaria socialis TaxID=392032 RepID=A0A820EGV6_9BILA|nr:unnamed protein product [Rotaria socialis]CAF4245979.1 unnamed protein product [Rotaria socialis]